MIKAEVLLYRTREFTGTCESKQGESTSPKSWTPYSSNQKMYGELMCLVHRRLVGYILLRAREVGSPVNPRSSGQTCLITGYSFGRLQPSWGGFLENPSPGTRQYVRRLVYDSMRRVGSCWVTSKISWDFDKSIIPGTTLTMLKVCNTYPNISF